MKFKSGDYFFDKSNGEFIKIIESYKELKLYNVSYFHLNSGYNLSSDILDSLIAEGFYFKINDDIIEDVLFFQ